MEGATPRFSVSSKALLLVFGLALVVLAVVQRLTSAWVPLLAVLGLAAAVWAMRRPLAAIAALAVYLPFEPFLLKFVPDEAYVFIRYVPELLIYVLLGFLLLQVVLGKRTYRHSVLDLPFALLLVVLLASTLINTVSPSVAVLGARQILRFIFLFFIVHQLAPDKAYIKRFTIWLFSVALFQAVVGVIQRLTGGALDALLLPSEARNFGDITLTSGTSQFWDPGSRVFATLGRYDRLGNLLAFFLALAVAFLYDPAYRTSRKELWWLLGLGVPALVFTFSRASWFAFLGAFLFIAVVLYRDKRVLMGSALVAAMLAAYVGLSGLNVRIITEAPGQTFVERFYETFSYARWRGEYYGLGRVFWAVQTPTVVIPASPFFGHGPGQYGGGAVSALHQTQTYDKLGLLFGVYGTDGYIDNNWFSIWGETGTLGLIAFLWMYVLLVRAGVRLFKEGKDPFSRALGGGYAAAMLGAALIGFLSTAFEIRTFGFYLWTYGAFVMGLLATQTKDKDLA